MIKYPMLLTPVPKETIWGGCNLKNKFGKVAPFDKIAESWELTVRKKDTCMVQNGAYANLSLADVIAGDYVSALGTNCSKYDRFPLLIKFIDAADKLSIQVHPDNVYSLEHEGELGKTEMWYIVDALPGAKIVYGLKKDFSSDDFARAVSAGKTESALNYVDVHRGEVYFIPAGQVHAIGSGIIIAEIQQNSDITYRVYDYCRRQPDGSLRQLHVEKALDVIQPFSEKEINDMQFSIPFTDISAEVLCSCDYFTSCRYSVSGGETVEIVSDGTSFLSLLVLDSDNARIEHSESYYPLDKGNSYFIPSASGVLRISGNAEFITTKIN